MPFPEVQSEAVRNEDSIQEVRMVKGKSLMKEVFNRFHINYEMSRVHKVGYYRESMSDSLALQYLAESIVDIYVPSNLNQNENASIDPIKTRRKAYIDLIEDDLLFGNASDMARSSIWRPNSFLNEKNRENHFFAYMGDSTLGKYEVAIVSFEPKKEKGLAKGRMFIDKNSYAILRIEYKPIIKKSTFWESVSWTEDFQFRHGAFELANIHFTGASTNQYGLWYEALLVMDQSEVVSRIPEYEYFIKDDVALFEQAEDNFSESFWDNFGYLKQYLKSKNKFIVAGN